MNKELLLEKYFEQSLTLAEKQEFEQLLTEDEDFAADFILQKKIKRAITLNEREALKQTLTSFEKEKNSKSLASKWLYAAACFILIVGFALWFSLQQNANEKLYETYYQTYPNIVAPTVRGTQTQEIKSTAFSAYDNGEYKLASELFDQIYTTEHTDFALFYKALSLMELKQYESAKESFKQFDFKKNNSFTIYFKWYLALAELQTDDKENAIIHLKELSKTENPMQDMAIKLLADLN